MSALDLSQQFNLITETKLPPDEHKNAYQKELGEQGLPF